MPDKQFIVRVPAVLWFEVSAPSERDAHWHAVQAYEWLLSAVNGVLALDENEREPLTPEQFEGYRVVADFDQASEVRGTLDLDGDDDGDDDGLQ